jgi:carbonic anhydrase
MAVLVRKNQEFTELLEKNLMSKHEEKRRLDNTVHVSDIIPTAFISKQYYSRKFPELSPLSNESVHHFVRGEASEFVITQLADMGKQMLKWME